MAYKEQEENLESLKKFFKISVASFEFAESIQKAFGGTMGAKHEEMKKMHIEALNRLETADLLNPVEAMKLQLEISSALMQMEILASQPYPPIHFEKGGIYSNESVK